MYSFLGEELKYVKRLTGWTSKEWSDKSGVSVATIDQICAGNRGASIQVLAQLAAACGKDGCFESFICARTADEIFDYEDVNANPNSPAAIALKNFLLWGGLEQTNTGNILGAPKVAVDIIKKAVKLGMSVTRITSLPAGDSRPALYNMTFTLDNDASENGRAK